MQSHSPRHLIPATALNRWNWLSQLSSEQFPYFMVIGVIWSITDAILYFSYGVTTNDYILNFIGGAL